MEIRIYQDTLFLSPEVALEEALKNNEVETISGYRALMAPQLCYYISDEAIANAPKNCIQVSLENFYNYFVTTKNRLPTKIEPKDSEFNAQELYILETALNNYLDAAISERRKLLHVYEDEIYKLKPNFNDEKLRVFLPTIRESVVLKHVSKNVADAFEKIGCEVLYYLPDELSNQNLLPKLHYQYEFNPHIVFTLNFFGNEILNDDIFYFCWFQDPVGILYNNEKIELRKRDYLLTLIEEFRESLLKKNVLDSKIIPQTFATNPKIFFEDKNIKRENKIVFLGSSYNFEKMYNISKNLINKITEHFENNTLTDEIISELSKEYRFDLTELNMRIVPAIIRKLSVIWMCKLKNIEIEIYGSKEWLEIEEVKPFYKGLLQYGEEIAKVYNSAKYAVAVNSLYMYQQRVFEIAACGAIPVIYKSNLQKENFEHFDNVLTYSTFEELKDCIGKEPLKSPTQITQDISYEKLAQKIVDIVRKDSNG